MARIDQKWRTVALLFAIACLNYADRTAISAVFPLIRSGLGASDVALAAVGSFFLWSYAIGSPIAGYLADRLSRKRMVFWSLVAWSAVTLVTGFVRSVDELLVTRVLLGLAECGYLPAAIALIADHHPPETRATAIGVHLAGLNFGLVAGGFVAGYLGEHFGWRLDFFVLGAAGLALSALTWFALQDGPDAGKRMAHHEPPWRSAGDLLRTPSYVILVVQAMLVSVGTWTFFNWLPLYFKETFQMSLAGAGFSGTFLLQMAATLGVAGGGFFSDRVAGKHPQRRMLLLSLWYFAAAPFLLAFRGQPTLMLVSISIFCYSLFRSLGSSNENPMICDLLQPHLRSTAIGLMNTANCFAGGIGILVAGYLKQTYGLGGAFGGVSVIVLVAGLLALAGYQFFLKKDLPPQPEASATAERVEPVKG